MSDRTTIGGNLASKARELLSINTKIDEQEELRKRAVRRTVWPVRILTAFGIYAVSVAIMTVFTLGKFDMRPFIIILAGLFAVLFISAVILSSAEMVDQLPTVKSIESEIAALKQDRRVLESSLKLTYLEAKVSHLDEAEHEIERLRKEGSKNGIYHNSAQSIIIIGSLSATTLSGLSIGSVDASFPAAIISLIVGISAGFSGYFKFRERSYYLNSTADAIGHEVVEFEQRIGRYRNRDAMEALNEFISESHRLRKEQKKQAQYLDRPSEEVAIVDS